MSPFMNLRHPEPDAVTKALPFLKVPNRQIRLLYGFHPEGKVKLNPINACYGNYLASSTMRERRENVGLNGLRVPLNGFLGLPLDIIYEVFGWLHPIELYSLLRTSKDVRMVLLDPNSTSMWTTSYRIHQEVPRLPSDLSDYPWWTTFIFGPDICQQCGCLGAIPNFCFRWRLCGTCMLKNCSPIERLKLPAKFMRHYPAWGFKPLFMAILPVSVQSSAFSWYTPQVFCKKQYKVRLREISQLLRRVKDPSGIPPFMDVCVAYTNLKLSGMKDIQTAESWVADIWNSTNRRYRVDTSNCVARWKAFLLKTYPDPVVQRLTPILKGIVERDQLSQFRKKVARRYFLELQPEIESLMWPYMQARRDQQQMLLRRLYKKVIAEHTFSFFDAGIRGPNPGWHVFLATLEREETTGLKVLLENESKRESFSPRIQGRIHLFVEEWMPEEKSKLADVLSGTQCFERCKLPGGRQDAIYLACAAFACIGCNHSQTPLYNTFFGWRQAHEHLGCVRGVFNTPKPMSPMYTFNEDAYGATVYLLEVLKLDPTVTLCSDLDKLNPMFLCLSCPETPGKTRAKGRLPMVWRDTVLHIVKHVKAKVPEGVSDDDDIHLVILSDPMKGIIRKHSQPYKPPIFPSWRCSRCSVCQYSRKDVLSHSKLSHSIEVPVAYEDYFVLPTNFAKYNVPSNAFRLAVGRDYSCCQCPTSRQSKLWELRDLRKHLKDSHGVDKAIKGEDYTIIPLASQVVQFSRKILVKF